MLTPVNTNGQHTSIQYGIDIALARADDLDKLMLSCVCEQVGIVVLELGCGNGGQSQRLVAARASVVAVDVQDFSVAFQELRRVGGWDDEQLRWLQADIRQLPAAVTEQTFSMCCLQRTLHYVRYDEAEKLLKQLKLIVTGELYISVTGLETAIGECYPAACISIESRFDRLSAVGSELFSIHEPVCLYLKAEFEQLLTASGWEIERCWTSAFGNHKAVCR